MKCPRCWKQYTYVPLRSDENGFLQCGICNYTTREEKPLENIPILHIPENFRHMNMQYWSGSQDNAQQALEKDYRNGKR